MLKNFQKYKYNVRLLTPSPYNCSTSYKLLSLIKYLQKKYFCGLQRKRGRMHLCQGNIFLPVLTRSHCSCLLQVKSCIKIFCAHLFSHVGLTALVVSWRLWIGQFSSVISVMFQVGYSIFGAFIFSHLEVKIE